MAQLYQIRDGIGFCRFDGRTIVLDLAADRYWQFGDETGRALAALHDGMQDAVDDRLVARLHERGLIEQVEAAGDAFARCQRTRAHAPSTLPTWSAIEQAAAAAPADWMSTAEVAGLSIGVRWRLRHVPLNVILDSLRARRAQVPPRTARTPLAQLAQTFATQRRLVPLAPRCLPDSLAFIRFAMRRGYAPQLVFGVEAFPFTAHCWAQDGDVVLSDTLDHARRFKPILVI